MIPSTGQPSSTSAISVPKIARPTVKLRVPSIGSSTHWRSGDAVLLAIFLADDAVARSFGVEQRAHRRLRLAIRQRDGGVVRLHLDAMRVAEIGADHRARGIGEAVGEVDIGCGDGHRACSIASERDPG